MQVFHAWEICHMCLACCMCARNKSGGGLVVALYRGFDFPIEEGVHQNFFIDQPRKPKDVDSGVHEYADKWFFEKINVYARSSTIICSTDMGQALEYTGYSGILTRIIPLGEAVFIYSKMVRDFVDVNYDLDCFCPQSVSDWLESKSYCAVHDVSLIDSDFQGEVMVFCREFSVVRCNGESDLHPRSPVGVI